ncbi:MAG: hypothetical protein ACK5XN_03505, partial [Bacteroidota bacterium]
QGISTCIGKNSIVTQIAPNTPVLHLPGEANRTLESVAHLEEQPSGFTGRSVFGLAGDLGLGNTQRSAE